MGEGLLKKKKGKKRGEKNTYEQQPRNTFKNYQCVCDLRNYNIAPDPTTQQNRNRNLLNRDLSSRLR